MRVILFVSSDEEPGKDAEEGEASDTTDSTADDGANRCRGVIAVVVVIVTSVAAAETTTAPVIVVVVVVVVVVVASVTAAPSATAAVVFPVFVVIVIVAGCGTRCRTCDVGTACPSRRVGIAGHPRVAQGDEDLTPLLGVRLTMVGGGGFIEPRVRVAEKVPDV